MRSAVVEVEQFQNGQLGLLPSDWQVARIRDVSSKPEYGYTATAVAEAVGPKLLRITDIRDHGVQWETVPYCRCPELKKRRYALSRGDLLVARIGATTGKSFLVQDCPEAVYGSYLIRIRPNAVDPQFLYYFCNSHLYWKQINAGKGGKLKQGISGSALSEVLLGRPPLPEQRAIAAILSKAQETVEIQAKIVATLKALKAATMAKLFREGLRREPRKRTEVGPIPVNWQVRPIAEVASVSTGTTPATERPEYYQGDIPFVKTAEIDNKVIEESRSHVSPQAVRHYNLRVYAPGTVFLAMYGQGKTRGKVAVLAISATTTQNTAAIQPGPDLDGEFLWHYLLSQYDVLRTIGNLGHLSHLNLGYVKALSVPVPPKQHQIEIAKVLSSLHSRIEAAEWHRRWLRSLFESALCLLMTGQLRIPPAMMDRLSREEEHPSWPRIPDEKLLQEILRRIVDAVAPEKIILFGSAARGEMTRDSDLDLLVIKRCERRREVERAIQRSIRGIVQPIDVIVATPEDIESHRDTIGLIYRPALREGKVLYDA